MSPGSSDRRVRKCVRMRSQENSKKRQNAEMGWFAENLSKCSETSRVRSGGIGFREVLLGRDAGIRTRDPLNPIQVRYQTAPRPDRKGAFEQGNGWKSNDQPPSRSNDESRFLVAALLGMTRRSTPRK